MLRNVSCDQFFCWCFIRCSDLLGAKVEVEICSFLVCHLESVVLKWGSFAPQGTFDNVWWYFWLSQLGVGQWRCYWYPEDGGQGCCLYCMGCTCTEAICCCLKFTFGNPMFKFVKSCSYASYSAQDGPPQHRIIRPKMWIVPKGRNSALNVYRSIDAFPEQGKHSMDIKISFP